MLNMDQPTSRHPIPMNGRNNRFSSYGINAAPEPGSQPSSFSQPTKNGGISAIWGDSQIRGGAFGSVQNDRRDDSHFGPLNDGKIGSSALGGETDWPLSQKSWTGSSSPAASSSFVPDRSPMRYRNNDSQSTRDTSPYNLSQQGPIGQGIGLGPPTNGSLMEGPGSYNENMDFQDVNRGRPNQRYSMMSQLSMGTDSQLSSMLKGLDGDGNRMVRSRVVSNSRNEELDHNVHADRSESLPPRQRTNSSSPYQHSDSYGQYPMASQPLGSGYGNANRNRGRYEDANPSFRDHELSGQIRHMSLEDTPYQRSQLSAQLANNPSQNPYPRVGDYSIGSAELQSYNAPSSGWNREPIIDNMAQFRGSHTVDVPNPGQRISDNRKSLPAGFHVNGSSHVNRNNQHGYSGVIPRDMPLYPTYMPSPGQTPFEYNPGVGSRNFSYQASPISPGLPSHSTQPRRSVHDDLSLRSAVLEDFRTNSKSKRYDLKDIYNHVVEFSGDQHGSRFIQTKLETANSDEKDAVFAEIRPNCLQLMTDVFGNYVIQKFFEHGNQVHKTILARQMEGHVVNLSLQMYGCRVVQKALEHVLFDQQASLIKELEGNVLKCVKDQNGNHVIQKAIERVPTEHIQFIIKAFDGQVYGLATHPYGCRVIQRMLEHCDETAQASILAELYACMYPLVQDQYGNYVTQHVIEHGKPQDRAKIIETVSQHVIHFSKHKFASNVVEKSIQYGSESQRRDILESITKLAPDGSSPLPNLIKDQFGNYVIQKLLTMLQGKDRQSLIDQIRPQLGTLKKFSFGKQISAIEKMMFMYAPVASDPTTPPTTSSERTDSPSPLLNGKVLSPESVSDAPSTTTAENKEDQAP